MAKPIRNKQAVKPRGGLPVLPAVLCFAAGGVAVGHELLWSRRMLDLLGGSADSATVAFGTFVLGMAVGAGLAARLLPHRPRGTGLLDAAACQAWFALTAVPVLFSIRLSDTLWPWLGAGLLAHPAGLAVRVLLAAALLLLPSIASGAFLPFLLAALCGGSRTHARMGPLVYGINTLGGLFAVVAVPLFLERPLGLFGCSALLTCLNVLLALGCLALHRTSLRSAGAVSGESGETVLADGAATLPSSLRQLLLLPYDAVSWLWRKPAAPSPAGRPSFGRHLLPACGTGALVLALEMLAYHQVAQVTVSSLHVTVMVLGAVLLGLGLGSLLAGGLRGSRQGLPICLLGTTVLIVAQPVLFCSLTAGLKPFAIQAGALPYTWQALRLAGLGVLPLFVAAGTLFPLLFSAASRQLADDCGHSWGKLLLANGFGCFGGAFLVQYVLMPYVGPWRGMGILGVASGTALVGLLIGRRHWIWLGVAFVLALYAVPRWGRYADLPLANPPDPSLIARDTLCGRDGIAVLLESRSGHRRILFNNSYSIGGSHSARLDRMEMLLPMMLHPSPRRVAAIGMGAGFTAEAALLDPGVERLDSVEISPLILELARTGFPRDRGGLFTDPRSSVHLTDGRIFLAAQHGVYDVIVGDLFVPWREGLAGLYSLEFCRSASGALADGGLYCQWIPLYQVREEEFDLIVRTFCAVFPDAWVVRNSFSLRNPAIGLVGRKGGAVLSEEVIRQRCAAIRQSPQIRNAFLRRAEGVSMHLVAPAASLVRPAPTEALNTLANARLGYMATAGILRPDWQPLTLERWRGLLAKTIEAAEAGPSDAWRTGSASAQAWLDAESAALAHDDNATHAAVAQALRTMPPALLDDPCFSWEDFLVDVPLPIPRSYRTLLPPPPNP